MTSISCSFLLKPLEPLYFGGPSSFGAGEKHVGISEFPPTPFAFQGLLRSHLLRSISNPTLDLNDWSDAAKNERKKFVGDPGSLPEGWQIQGPYPAIQKKLKNEFGLDDVVMEPWVPTPRFLLLHELLPLHARPVISVHPGINDLGTKPGNNRLLLLGRPEENALSPLGGWIGPENFFSALTGEETAPWDRNQFRESFPEFIKIEHQPGVAINSETATAEPGKLYMLKALRFSGNSGLAGWFSGNVDGRIPTDPFSRGAAGAGRKGRVALFEDIAKLHPAWEKVASGKHLPDKVEENDSFWLVAVSPVRLKNPAEPEISSHLPPDISLVVRGALTGPPVIAGGYQMATGQSRLNKPYLPAGSAWLFQLKGGDPQKRAKALRSLNNAHKLGPSNEGRFGFGHTFVGIGPQIKETET